MRGGTVKSNEASVAKSRLLRPALEQATKSGAAIRGEARSPHGHVLAIGTFGVAIVLYTAYVSHFGVNVPHWDDWTNVGQLDAYKHGQLTLSQLWSQHNENRMLIPNVIALLLVDLTHLNVKDEMYLGIALLVIGALSLIAAMTSLTKRRWLTYSPVLIVLLAPVQWESSLWGFEFAWFLVTACFGGAIFFICRSRSQVNLGLAMLLATVASFSSIQGLLVWPAIAILIWGTNRSVYAKATWIVAAVIVYALYFVDFKFDETGGSGVSAVLSHPIPDFRFFLTALGGIALGSGGVMIAQILGFCLLVTGIGVVMRYLRSKGSLVQAIPAVLVIFAFLFDVALVFGRTGFGYGPALQSRYTTYNLLIVVALYLSIVEHERSGDNVPFRKYSNIAFVTVAASSGAALIYVSATTAITESRHLASQVNGSASVLVNIRHASNPLIAQFLTIAPPESNVTIVRKLTPFLIRQHDSVFADPSLVRSLSVKRGSDRIELLPRDEMLPAQPAIDAVIHSSLKEQCAWAVLSTVYFARPDLQVAFPEQSPRLDKQVLDWAITVGAITDYERSYLSPELTFLKRLYRSAAADSG